MNEALLDSLIETLDQLYREQGLVAVAGVFRDGAALVGEHGPAALAEEMTALAARVDGLAGAAA